VEPEELVDFLEGELMQFKVFAKASHDRRESRIVPQVFVLKG